MAELSEFHPGIQAAVKRHQEFFAGKRDWLVNIHVPVQCDDLPKPVAFDDVDWANGFEIYVRSHVEHGKRTAERRLAMDIGDDYIPCYYPRFGSSIHHSFWGGKVTFSHGTSYVEPVITRSSDWRKLRADLDSPWLRKLAWGIDHCREHGDGVILPSYRGANGPLDMANGVMGNSLFTEMYDDPDNMRNVMDSCTDSIPMLFEFQQEHVTDIDGGRMMIMGGLWMPDGTVGHISLDAACLAGPRMYEKFERPWFERMVEQTGPAYVHTHMLGRALFRQMAATKGVMIFAPSNDPKQPTVVESIDSILRDIGEVPLALSVPSDQLAKVLPKLRGRRALLYLQASSPDEAKRLLGETARHCERK